MFLPRCTTNRGSRDLTCHRQYQHHVRRTPRTGSFCEIAFTASGVISDVLVEEGESVKKGQPLIRLGDASDTNYASAQLELVSAEQAINDLTNAAGTDLAQAVIKLKDAQEAYEKADNYLVYLRNSKKVLQSETKLFLETKRKL
jgi:multidrug resistance efflux pump